MQGRLLLIRVLPSFCVGRVHHGLREGIIIINNQAQSHGGMSFSCVGSLPQDVYAESARRRAYDQQVHEKDLGDKKVCAQDEHRETTLDRHFTTGNLINLTPASGAQKPAAVGTTSGASAEGETRAERFGHAMDVWCARSHHLLTSRTCSILAASSESAHWRVAQTCAVKRDRRMRKQSQT